MSALRTGAAVLVIALAVGGCKDDERPPGVPPASESSIGVTPVFEAPPDTGPAASAAGLLLTYEEIGDGYVPVPYEPADPSVPAPCGGPSADSQWPPVAVVGAEADRQAASVQVVEELRVYSDDASAAAAFDGFVSALTCPTATLVGPVSSVVVTMGAPADVSAVVGAPATRIDVAAAEFTGAIVIARSGPTVATVEVYSRPASPDAPDTAAIAAQAVAKVAAS